MSHSCPSLDTIKSRCMWRRSVFGQVKHQLDSPDFVFIFQTDLKKAQEITPEDKGRKSSSWFSVCSDFTSCQNIQKIFSFISHICIESEHFMHIHVHNSNLPCKLMKNLSNLSRPAGEQLVCWSSWMNFMDERRNNLLFKVICRTTMISWFSWPFGPFHTATPLYLCSVGSPILCRWWFTQREASPP